MELCLGTVQFGMDYGITGKKKPPQEDAVQCLDYAAQNGILAFDTAAAYGSAEDVLGAFLKKRTIPREKLTISSKVPPNILDGRESEEYFGILQSSMEQSLRRLHTDYLDVYVFHSARYVFQDAMLEALNRLKAEGRVKKIGVSVYEPEEAKHGIYHPLVDFLQLPYSIFDQRMRQQGVFAMAEGSGTQIDIRSAFIQGLIVMSEEEVPPFLSKARPIVARITKICDEYRISRVALALQFVKMQEAAAHLVFGVHSLEQLREDVELFAQPLNADLISEISQEFTNLETDIVMPSLWVKS